MFQELKSMTSHQNISKVFGLFLNNRERNTQYGDPVISSNPVPHERQKGSLRKLALKAPRALPGRRRETGV